MTRTGAVLGLWLACTLFAVALTAEVNSVCRTSQSLPGTCIPLAQCQLLLEVYSKPRPLSSADKLLLRAEQCGILNGKPLVCCLNETAATPELNTRSQTQHSDHPVDVSNHSNVELINPEFCGQISSPFRIFNGKATRVFEMPWMAMLKVQFHDGTKLVENFVCGGSLINRRYVLTAAHCLSNKTSSRLVSVRLGEHDTSKDEDCETVGRTRVCALPPQNINVESFVKHPGYSVNSLTDDIGLIRLAEPADVDRKTIVPICLPVGMAEQTKNLDDQELIVAGWGMTEKGVTSPQLLKVTLPVISTEKCQALFSNHDVKITKALICAGGSHLKEDSCKGDSGGPLKAYGMPNDEDLGMVEYGIVSSGHKECATVGTPGLYTHVGHYMKWILDNIEPF